MRPCVFALVLLLALAACGSGSGSESGSSVPTTRAEPTSTIGAPTPSVPTSPRAATTTTVPAATTAPPPTWVLGAHPLPTTPQGYGVVEPTPTALVDRRLTAPDRLPPPGDGRFHSTVGPITASIRDRMGETYHDGCPVTLAQLRYLTLTFRGFDGRAHTGELVVAARVADDVVGVFRELFSAGFPIEEMRLPTTADVEAEPTGDGNDTAAFVCRATRGSTRWSSHARGLAIDLDPFQNPYTKRGVVLPELAGAYVDRSNVRPGMILPGGPAVRAFAAIGWTWGGTWHSPVDRQHFSADGR